MGETCKFFLRLCNASVDRFMKNAFRSYGLCWYSVRFALTVTGGVISGFFGFYLAFMRGHEAPHSLQLDVFISGAVQCAGFEHFLELAGDFIQVKSLTFMQTNVVRNPSAQILETVVMERRGLNGDNARVDVHHCSDTPLTAVFWQPLTCLHTWMSGAEIFIAYPDMTFARRTMVSDTLLPLDFVDAHSILHGVDTVTYHGDSIDACGSSRPCLPVFRHSADSMCFHMAFSTPGCVRDATAWWSGRVIQWNSFDFDSGEDPWYNIVILLQADAVYRPLQKVYFTSTIRLTELYLSSCFAALLTGAGEGHTDLADLSLQHLEIFCKCS
ncbi:hypothetical protein K438DRAFT_1766824 [Mycena galopus ATCC 62051]|nr:hypothetical protein K438DRAFT_1766824 [Mycena galopus ATCC 62051]